MTHEEARLLLGTCRREELRDHAFGDCEVIWTRDDEDVAFGYFGGDVSEVCIGSDRWTGFEASLLRECGAIGRVARNDSTGPAKYSEGTTMPALTREGVLEELTSRSTSEGGD